MAIYIGPDGQEVDATLDVKHNRYVVKNRSRGTFNIEKVFFERRYRQKFPRMFDYNLAKAKKTG